MTYNHVYLFQIILDLSSIRTKKDEETIREVGLNAYLDLCSPITLQDSFVYLIWIAHARSRAYALIHAI